MNQAREFAESMLLGLSVGTNLSKILRTRQLNDNDYYWMLVNEVEKVYLTEIPVWAYENIIELLEKSLKGTQHEYIVDHTSRVRNLALQIAPRTADKEALEFAALFHDLGKYKGESVHSEQAARIARAWLLKNDFPSQLASKVVKAILTHHTEPSTLEGKALHDADCLDKIGISGVSLLLIKSYQKGISLDELIHAYKENESWIQDKHGKKAACNFSFVTSRELALSRLKFMDKFFEECSQ